MAEIDDELVARAIRWCAEAGRQASAGAVRDALAPLSWDQLLAARALLADPPPARPLGPRALADLARGALPDVAAEREREGRYPADGAVRPGAGDEPTLPAAAPRPRKARAAGRKPVPGPLIRRARDRAPPAPASPPGLPCIDDLFRPEGRSVLEGLIRRQGARAGALITALGAGWRRADGGHPADDDLRALLETHGLRRAFARRERAAALHALRAAGGVRARAAAALAVPASALDDLLARTGAAREAEAIREGRRAELRRRATLAERARLLLSETERLGDLGLLTEFEGDLRARLPEHLRALRAGGRGPLPAALGRSLSLARPEVDALVARLGLSLAGTGDAQPAGGAPPTARPEPRRSGPRPGGARPPAGGRDGPPRPAGRRAPSSAGAGSRTVPRAGAKPGRRGGPGAGTRPSTGPGSRPRRPL